MNRIISLLIVCIFIFAFTPTDVRAETYEIGLYAEEFQEIYGWGAYPCYARSDWGAAFAPPVNRPGVFKAIFGDSGLTMFRTDYQPRFYNSAADDGSINPTAINDLITMVKGAAEYGVTDYLISIWSPPAVMKNTRTVNGRDDDGNISSLLKDREQDYINFICSVTDYIREQGVKTPAYISLGNEPTYAVWYDSCVYSAEQYQRLIVMLRKELDARGHTDVKVVAGEGNNYHYNYDLFGFNYDDFFLNQEFQDAVDVFASHSYDSANYSMANINQMRDLIRKIDRPFMQSEWCPEGPNFSERSDIPLAYAIHSSRHFAREMADVGFNYWFWWNMWTESVGNMGLIGGESPVTKTHNYNILSKIWTNSPPGSRAKKLYTTDPELISTGASEIDMVGFSNAENNKTTLLIVNPKENDKSINLKYIPGKNIEVYRLDGAAPFRHVGNQALNSGEAMVSFPAESVTVIISDGAKLDRNAPQPEPVPELSPIGDISYFVSSSILSVEAKRASVGVDGLLNENEWDLTTSLDKLITGTTDNKAKFSVLYDDKYLYVGVDVKDNAVCDSTSAAGHFKDSVEIYIDAGNEKGAAYDRNDYQLQATIVPNKVLGGRGLGDMCIMASKITDEGYTTEIAIPWAGLDVNPMTSGGVFGFDISINDNDDGVTRTGQIMWSGTNNNWQNSEKFGECILSGVSSGENKSDLKMIFDDELRDVRPLLTRAVTSAGEPKNGSASLAVDFKGPSSVMFRFNDPVTVTPVERRQVAASFWAKAASECRIGVTLLSESNEPISTEHYVSFPENEWVYVTIPLNMFEDLGRNSSGSLQLFNYGNIVGLGFEGNNAKILIDDLKIDSIFEKDLPFVSNLTSKGKTSSSISILWDKVDNVSGYKLYRNHKEIKTFNASETSYTDEDLIGNMPYVYHMTTVNSEGKESRQSNYLIEKTIPGLNIGGDADITAEYSRFYDDIRDYEWAIFYIDFLTERNIIKGEYEYNGNMFKPDEYIKHKDLTLMLAKLFGSEAYEKNLTDEAVTRQDLSLILNKILKLDTADITALRDYTDISDIDDNAATAFAAMVEAGYIKGSNQKLLPKAYVTRAEAMVTIGRICLANGI